MSLKVLPWEGLRWLQIDRARRLSSCFTVCDEGIPHLQSNRHRLNTQNTLLIQSLPVDYTGTDSCGDWKQTPVVAVGLDRTVLRQPEAREVRSLVLLLYCTDRSIESRFHHWLYCVRLGFRKGHRQGFNTQRHTADTGLANVIHSCGRLLRRLEGWLRRVDQLQ